MDGERGGLEFADKGNICVGDYLVDVNGKLIPIGEKDERGVSIFEDGCIKSHFLYSDVTIRTRDGRILYGQNQNCQKRQDCPEQGNCPPNYRKTCARYNASWDRA